MFTASLSADLASKNKNKSTKTIEKMVMAGKLGPV